MEPTNQEAPKSLLNNLRQHHVVNVFNPLSTDFRWPVARSVVHDDPRFQDPTMKQLNMRNVDKPKMAHVQQWILLPAGQHYKVPGDVAQVVVKHLVDEILSKEGHKQNMGDPELRREVEERVIQNINDLRSSVSTQSLEDQLNQQLADLNREDTSVRQEPQDEEQPFADLKTSGEAASGSDSAADGEVAFAGHERHAEGAPAPGKAKRGR